MVAALLTSPSIGIVAGGLVGPAVGLLLPAAAAREIAPLGTPASAERYSMPGSRTEPGSSAHDDRDDPPTAQPDGDGSP